ncbi:Zinc finger CCCH domain-containing protein 44 [Senna tora]|uniref:Zinc finger CCCH domain-containing protein 44 n=1 Tax=Senna tora TaxID=362788 RepID=A0A834TUR6_9FABA|nr:Zinc finger CCCH domain-containing protein 44 [Senna tora]
MDKPDEQLQPSPMDKPSLPEAERQSFDGSDTTMELITIDPCQTMRHTQDSQLVGVPLILARDADVAGTHLACLPNMELKVADGTLGKRKRGRPARGIAKAPPLKKNRDEEDVCFICFDGGSLVLCDRRGCPKAYHPACIKRDDAFFRSKAKWNCGWHICSICRKASHYMCYTCTYSLCKGCTKDADYLCVRGNKGLCGICMRTIMLIENSAQGNKETCEVDFDDKSSWEYLFKVYWLYLKEKLSLTLDELHRAKNPWRGAAAIGCKVEIPHEAHLLKDDKGSGSENSCIDIESNNLENSQSKKQPRLLNKVDFPNMKISGGDKGVSMAECTKWASKELLEFVAHMKNGDTSLLSQFDVQTLLLEYVKKNNLRDPRQRSQIVCDSRLVNLFGRARVGHFEMLKLLESHFLIKDDASANNTVRSGIIDAVASQVDGNDNYDHQLMVANDKRRKTHKRAEVLLNNPDAYAAINAHNINLVYLRRNQMENLIEDAEKFNEKVVGSIVRIRISSSDQKQEMYRLVQVVGTSNVAESYNIGSRTTYIVLEISNLNKTEVIPINEISNQEFSEEECKRLRQSIKYGFSKRLTVGEILDKALTLQAMRVNELLDAEILRLNHLRDRASEKGHRKELRECVEKLQLLNSPEERQRRLQEIPEVYSDPNMDSMFDSDEDDEKSDVRKQDDNIPAKESGLNIREREPSSPRSQGGVSTDTGCRALNFLATAHDQIGNIFSIMSRNSPNNATNGDNNNVGVATSGTSGVASDISSLPPSGTEQPFNDYTIDKLWHYLDPSGKVQGPFTILQLYKWKASGHFPPDLRIWRVTEKQDDSILLSDALGGKCSKNVTLPNNGQLLSLGFGVGLGDKDVIDLPNPTPVTSSSNCFDSASAFVPQTKTSPKIHEFDFLELPDHTPKTTNSEPTGQSADAGPSWSTASSLVGGGTPLPEVTVEWRRCSPAPPNPSVEEWDSNLASASSLKPTETVGDCTATPSSICDQLTHSSPSHPACHTSTWQAIIGEPNDFGSLDDESVSDLLAEVEAMESLGGGLESPASIMNCGEELTEGSKTDCLSSAEGLSPMPDAGKGDALSSTGDLHFPSRSTASEVPLCQADVHHHQRISGGNSSRSSESEVGTKNGSVSGNQWNSGSEIPSTITTTATWDMGTDTTWRLGSESTRGWETSQVNTNLGWGGMDKGNPNMYWGIGQGAVQGNRNTNTYASASMGNQGILGSQPRYGSDRFSPRGRDMSSGKGRYMWNRQPFGVGNGGSQRPPPKGQRICKFYESGYCRKGASCDYWHP